MLLFQVWCISRGWKEVGTGNIDFAALYEAASSVHRGSAPDYDPSKIAVADSTLNAPHWNPASREPSVGTDMLHPPFEVLLFLPLTFLRYSAACIVWCICNLAFLWLVPFVLWKHIPRLHSELHLLAVVFGLMRQVIFCLVYGQDSILLLLLLSLSVASLAERRDFRAGVFLALGLFKFHLVLPIIAALIVVRNWRAVAGFFAGFIGLLLGTFAVMGIRALNYFPYIFRYSQHISLNAREKTSLMPNLRGLVAFIAGPVADAKLQSVIVVSISAALLALVLAWIFKFRDLPIAIPFSLAIATASLISYHYFPHNAVILLIPVLLIANHFLAPEANQKLCWMFAAASVAFCLSTFGFFPLESAMPMLAIDSIALALVIFASPYTMRLIPPAISRDTDHALSPESV